MSSYLSHWINFIILFAVVGLFLFKQLTTYFAKQRESFKQQVDQASKTYAEAEAEFRKAKQMHDELQSRLAEIRASSKREIELESSKIKSEAESTISKFASDGELRIKNEAEKARLALESELLEKALVSAREAMKKEFKTRDTAWTGQMIQVDGPQARGRKTYAS